MMDRADDPLATDPLAQRLSELELPVSCRPRPLGVQGAGGSRGPAASGLRRRRARAALIATLAIVGVLALNLAGARFISGYEQALAAVPVLGQITNAELAAAGTSAAQLQPQSATGTLDGIAVTITEAFADPIRTTVFVKFGSPAECLSRGGLFADMFVSDSRGQDYPLIYSDGCPRSAFAVTFAPLPEAELDGSQRLVLHVMVSYQSEKVPFTPASATGPSLDLPFTVTPVADVQLVPPPPVVNHGTTYAIRGLTVTGDGLDVTATVKGSLIDQLYACAAAAPAPPTATCPTSGVSFPGMYVITPSGAREWPAASYGAFNNGAGKSIRSALGISPNGTQSDDWLFDLQGPGRYQLVFQWSEYAGPYPSEAAASSAFGVAEASWTITVP